MRRTIFAIFGTVACAAICAGGLVDAQGPESGGKKGEGGEVKGGPEPKQKKKLYYGVSACSDCHAKEKEVTGEKALLYRGIEMHIWNKSDKHKDATKNIKYGKRGKDMMTILQKAGGWENGALDARCINCHGVYVDEKTPVHNETFGTKEDRETSGVSCVVCHGPYATWVNAHAVPIPVDDEGWRTYTPEYKQSLGLNNLWDPAVRAELCCSCHVGNIKEGKLVTHEMYAAGHPPLPGFEIQTYSEAMPKHWEHLNDKISKAKNYKNRENFYTKIGYQQPNFGDQEQTRMLVISAIVAFRESVKLLHDSAKASLDGDKNFGDGPEFALYDCYACHHDLKSPSWRQLRGYKGLPPGRPQMRPWSQTLVPLAVLHANKDSKYADFDTRVKGLETVLSEKPFGKESKVVAETETLIKWCDSLLADVRKTPFDEKSSRKLLAALVQRNPKEYLDWDSARMVGWGLRTMLPELKQDSALERAEMKELEKTLTLDFVKGQKEIVGEYLNMYLQNLSKHEPAQFRKTLDGLQDLVDGVPKKKAK